MWYNFVATTADTVIDAPSVTTTNAIVATQDICPKGWRLPTQDESQALASAIGSSPTIFNPVHGGFYDNRTVGNVSDYGRWWSSTANTGQRRYNLRYTNSSMDTGHASRANAFYVRCIAK